jgi:hypothetical protein
MFRARLLGGACLEGPVLVGDFGGGAAAGGGSGGLATGGDASIQSGVFYAAAPWRSIQATPSMFRALPLVGWVEEKAKTKIPAAKTYALGLGQPPPGGWDGKSPFFVQNGLRFHQSTRLTTPDHGETSVTDSLCPAAPMRPQKKPALIPQRGLFEQALRKEPHRQKTRTSNLFPLFFITNSSSLITDDITGNMDNYGQ